jgi:hypothetical protein
VPEHADPEDVLSRYTEIFSAAAKLGGVDAGDWAVMAREAPKDPVFFTVRLCVTAVVDVMALDDRVMVMFFASVTPVLDATRLTVPAEKSPDVDVAVAPQAAIVLKVPTPSTIPSESSARIRVLRAPEKR